MITALSNAKRFCLYLIFVGVVFFVSCAPYRDIEVKDFSIDNIAMQGSRIVLDFSATVNNPNRSFVLDRAGGDLSIGEHPFAAAILMQAVRVAARSEERCAGQLQLTIKDLMAALQMGFDTKSWDLDSFLFSGDVQVKSAGMKKKFKYNNVPLNRLINSL